MYACVCLCVDHRVSKLGDGANQLFINVSGYAACLDGEINFFSKEGGNHNNIEQLSLAPTRTIKEKKIAILCTAIKIVTGAIFPVPCAISRRQTVHKDSEDWIVRLSGFALLYLRSSAG